MDGMVAFKSLKCMVDNHVLENKSLRITMTNSQTKPMKSLLATSSHTEGCNSKKMNRGSKQSILSTMNKIAKGKLSLGAKILQGGGVEKMFRQIYNVSEDEQLLKASHCCLFTTTGPLAGRLFISSEKLAFCSDKAIAMYSSPSGEAFKYHYKIVIPLRKIKNANQNDSLKRPSRKYLQVVTDDDFEFWFVGFVSYKKTFRSLQQALVSII